MTVELDVVRAFPLAQTLLSVGGGLSTALSSVGWHGTSVEDTEGATAVVPEGWAGLVGDTLRVRCGSRTALVYVMGVRDVPVDVSLSRRAFLTLAPLWRTELAAVVEVLR